MSSKVLASYAMPSTAWFTNTCNVKTIKPRAASKKVTYPFFNELARFTADPYWKEVLITLGLGKLPSNTIIDHGLIQYKKTASSIIKLELDISFMQTNDPAAKQQLGEEMYMKLKNFLTQHVGMLSDIDRENMLQTYQQKTSCKKNLDEDVVRYAKEQTSKLGLHLNKEDVEKKLITMINLARLTKILVGGDFIYSEPEKEEAQSPGSPGSPLQKETPQKEKGIVFIDGLLYDDKTGLFYINPLKIKKPRKAAKSTAKIKLSEPIERWNTFVNSVQYNYGFTINSELSGSAVPEYSTRTR